MKKLIKNLILFLSMSGAMVLLFNIMNAGLGKSSEGSGFSIMLGLTIVMLAAVILFYNNKEDK